jgi:hypothetical protein
VVQCVGCEAFVLLSHEVPREPPRGGEGGGGGAAEVIRTPLFFGTEVLRAIISRLVVVRPVGLLQCGASTAGPRRRLSVYN